MLIIFVDTVFEADLTLINRTNADGIIWAKEVEDYQRFGVVVTDKDGYMTKIVEKPSDADLQARQHRALLHQGCRSRSAQGIDHVLQSPANKGEYFLTDAFQHMIEHGRQILTAEVGGWYDCGKLGHDARDQRDAARHGAAKQPAVGPDVTILEPVLIEEGCTLERCTIGPNVTLEAGCTVRDSTIADAIIGAGCIIERSTLTQAMLGEKVIVRDFTGSGSIGSNSEVAGAA